MSVSTNQAGTNPALEISHLQAWYGESHILHDVNLVVNQGEVVTLLGRNGAGRTTTMRAIMGLTGARKGSIKINGVEAIHLPTHKVAHLGVGYCPEERGIFSSLSTEENLMLPPLVSRDAQGMSVEEIYDMFPNLAERKTVRVRVCPVVNNRCWQWRAFCVPGRVCYCWTKFPKVWHR
jgi:branched-chain amino acid transport system ATP-binding protein